MFELTIAQGKQVLLRESKFVRKRVVEWLERFEEANKPMTAGEILMAQAQGMIALEKAQQAQAEQIALQNERLTKIKAAKICVQRSIPMGNEYDAKYGFVKSYPTEVLKEIFETK